MRTRRIATQDLKFPDRLQLPLKELQKNVKNVDLKINEIPAQSCGGTQPCKVTTKRKRSENNENSLEQVTTSLKRSETKLKEEKPVNKKPNKKKVFEEYRYFCSSCCCYVDGSSRRHDLRVHMAPKRAFEKGPMKPAIIRDLCEKKCGTLKRLNLHKERFHEHDQVKKGLKQGQVSQVTPKAKPKMILECFECNSLVPRKDYIEHLKAHDSMEKKADTVNMLSPAKGKPFRSFNSVREEYMERRFVYINPEDPRWNSDDAILQCRHCPFKLFLNWSKYEKHVRRLHPYVPGSSGETLPITGN
ncbi:unnamed protein product [Allacma fusca]|uniref:Uncharacterized protein n=1 Tax=Allacma fusca TaxID=39272 RepID=A0A8J2NX65_9HEXA|nr:unnamed protein product [Allacma fusca]